MTSLVTPDQVRHRIRVIGVVQGVGFRPFVHRLATELTLVGHVGNDAEGVFIEVQGRPDTVEAFEIRLVAEAPPLARILTVETSAVATATASGLAEGFSIAHTRAAGAVKTYVSPDIAVCDDCLAELFDPSDRRSRYPFINCTNCGPRFTITVSLPYDRPTTTIRGFPLCAKCDAEYHNPDDRRFHAQPVACAECGPRLWFDAAGGVVEGTDRALEAAQGALAEGKVVAIKGIGGYHLACDATSKHAVELLRRRKQRLHKPFAVMARDLSSARGLARIDAAEASVLTSPERPIVLLRQHAESRVATGVAPGNPHLGMLLPYSPLHHLLFHPVPGSNVPVPTVLVMTSGNLTDEPICYDDTDARRRLGGIADAWLTHDRPIHVPCDDSVVRLEAGEVVPLRRSRGYAPLPVRLPFSSVPTLAMGGELKNTFALAAGDDCWVSQHVGDMGSLETLAAFERSTQQFADIYRVDPRVVAADAHPGYQTRRWAEEVSGLPVELVQHHHAHIASVMAEHVVPAGEQVIGVAFDGTGFGDDGAVWGGEVLIAGYDTFDRAAHLRYVPLPGGDATIRKPYRATLAHLWSAGIEWTPDLPPVSHAHPEERSVLQRQLERDVHCVPTSSMGRLFDAVSSLLGLRQIATYEAQAAMELEWTAEGNLAGCPSYAFGLTADQIDPGPVLRSLVDDLRHGCPVGSMAAGFHVSVARAVAEVASRLRPQVGTDVVALSGGVFQNVLLTCLTREALRDQGFTVLTHRVVPANDGGLALGQAAVAGRRASIRTGA